MPGQAARTGRSLRKNTPHSTDSATPVTALTGTTTLIAPRARPRLRQNTAVPLPAPDNAPHQTSGERTAAAGTRTAAASASSSPPICPRKGTTAKCARRDSSPPAKSTTP
ncbi:hypothetical protein ACFY6U_47690 [Streptomyces sp. NPDC013157]|uniref:hypothetical protein n=1 Tax=Streptomyces sp. NPDC013157 TaxID=3364861 RepID=UPI0036A9DF00